jgi:hypothetical protein
MSIPTISRTHTYTPGTPRRPAPQAGAWAHGRCAAAVLALLLTAAIPARSAEPAARKPIGLAGASYGTYEVQSVIRNVLSVSADQQCVFAELGGTVPADALGRYSLIIIADGLAQPLSPDESRAFAGYVHGGGHVLLIGQAPLALTRTIGFTNAAWMGISRIQPNRGGTTCAVSQADAPWLHGVLTNPPSPAWLAGGHVAVPSTNGMRALIGTPAGASLFGVRTFGQGWVAFLGHELFRMRGESSPLRPDSPSWIRLIDNIVAAADPLRERDVRAAAFRAAAGQDLWVWTREWQTGEPYGPRFDPPLPAPAECVTSLAADLAMDEFELLQLNLTPLKDLGDAQGRFETGAFPAGRVRLFVQDRPDPIPWEKDPAIALEFPYWLMPPEQVAPKGSAAFAMPVRETRILWVKLDSFGVTPGRYPLTLHVDFAGGKRVALPIEVTVHPVRLPRNRHIKLMPAGTSYGDVRAAAPARRFMENLESHGFEWSLFNVVRPADARLRGEAAPLDAAALRQCRDRLAAGGLPALDFSAYDDWVEQSIDHNQTCFRMGDIAATLRSSLNRAGIREGDEAPVEQWFCRAFSRYLREKGVRVMVAGIGDELSAKELVERYIPWAERMSAAGWGCSSSFTGIHNADPALNALLAPHVTLWTLNRGLALPFTEGVRDGTLKVRPDAIIGTYGAGEGRGTEIRKAPGRSRFLGWESWLLGIRNCAPNPYFKGWLYYVDYRSKDYGLGGERFVAYLDKDDPAAPLINSPFLEGIREGMEEGNLCAILSWYLDHMPASDVTAGVRRRLQRVLAPDPAALLPWRASVSRNGLRSVVIQGDSAAFRVAKREVLACLDALRGEALRTVRPSLYWHDLPLLQDGRPLAAIYTAGAPPADLLAAIRGQCGQDLPVLRSAGALDARYPVAIVVGSAAQNPLTQTLLAQLGEEDATDAYPGPGRYFIKELPRPGMTNGTILLVAGPDEAGTAKGLRMFSRFLRAEGAWLLAGE